MAVSLSKGQKVDLTKGNPGLKNIIVGLGWDTNKYDGGNDFDLDASAFILGEAGKVKDDKDFIFYNNPTGAQGSVVHTGDNRSGVGDGDDEQIKIDISKIPAEVQKIAFTITIHDGEARKQNFGQVGNAYVRVLNEETGAELIRYDLGEDFSIETAVVVAEVYRNGAEWKFNAIGSGFQGGLSALCTSFGLSVA
jgi:tellurium resistance protein TerD